MERYGQLGMRPMAYGVFDGAPVSMKEKLIDAAINVAGVLYRTVRLGLTALAIGLAFTLLSYFMVGA